MEDKKAFLAIKAAQLFLNEGYKKTTMKKLGEAAGLHPSGIYYYFKSKEEILDYIYDKGEELFLKEIVDGGCETTDPQLKIKTTIANTMKSTISSREIVLLMIQNFPSKQVSEHRKEVATKGANFFRDLLKRLADSKGVDRPIDLTVATFCLVAIMIWPYRWYNPKGRLGIEELTDNITRLFLHGFYSGEASLSGPAGLHGDLRSEFAATWQEPQDKKEVLANTASRLFLEEGYEMITMERLGEVMNFQPSAVYHYFKSKDEILMHIVKRAEKGFGQTLFQKIQEIEDKEERIRTTINAVIGSFVRFDGVALMAFQSLPVKKYNIARNIKTKAFLDTIRSTLSDLAETKHIRNGVDPTVAAFSLIAMTMWVYKWYKPHGHLTLQDVSDHITRLFFHGFYQGKYDANDRNGYLERIRQIASRGAKYRIGRIGNEFYLIGGKCQACGRYFSHVPQECTSCRSQDVRQVALSRRGRIVDYDVTMAPSSHAESSTHPLVIAQVELPEKICVLGVVTNIDDAEPVKVGDEVKLYFFSAGLDENGIEAMAYGFRLQLEQA